MSVTSSEKMKNIVIIILLLIILGLVGGIVYIRQFSAIARVNGETISRVHFVEELEKQSGPKVIDTLINRTLIYQAAESNHIRVSDTEIKEEIKLIEKNVKSQKSTLDAVLKTQHLTMEDLYERVRLNKLSQKLVKKNTTVSDKEVDAYIAKNSDSISENPVSNELREQIREQIKQQKTNTQVQLLLTNLKKESKITIYFP